MPCKYLAELVGTFIFMNCVLSGQPVQIAVGLLSSVYVFGMVSGGHFNPAVTLMSYLKDEVSSCVAVTYVLVQLIATYGALMWNTAVKKKLA